MALQVNAIKRKFIFENDKEEVELVDYSPSATPEQVLDFYSGQYPALTTASIEGPSINGEFAEYRFQPKIGNKG